MKHSIESKFKNAKNHLTLSQSEKDFHRESLLQAMRATAPRVIASPYHPVISPFLVARYAFVALFLISAGGTGAAFASENALPNSPLYAMKVKVVEPVQLAFTFDEKKRADLEIEFVDRRLEEFGQVSLNETLTTKNVSLVTDSLTEHINNVQEDIAAFHNDRNITDAYETTSSLGSTLDAHADILDKISSAHPVSTENVSAVAQVVDSESDETDTLAKAAKQSLEGSSDASFEHSVDEQEEDVLSSLQNIKAEVARALTSFDAGDQASVNASLKEINDLVMEAATEDAAGNAKNAYLLYTEAGKRITGLQTAVTADQTLGIDVIEDDSKEENP